jgi:hypothetical protein
LDLFSDQFHGIQPSLSYIWDFQKIKHVRLFDRIN